MHFSAERPDLLIDGSKAAGVASGGEVPKALSGENPDARGVAVLWKKGLLSDVQCSVEPSSDQAVNTNPAAIVRGRVQKWGDEVVFATKHLDALGSPPSCQRCEQELPRIGMHAQDLVRSNPGAVAIFGGDCNITGSSPAISRMTKLGYRCVSGAKGGPTQFSSMLCARFDHVFATGDWGVSKVDIPVYPHSTQCCYPSPCLHPVQVLNDWIGISRPKVGGAWSRVAGFLCLPVYCMGVLTCLVCPMPQSVKRCQWALKEFGSDHLPVTVTFSKKVKGTSR